MTPGARRGTEPGRRGAIPLANLGVRSVQFMVWLKGESAPRPPPEGGAIVFGTVAGLDLLMSVEGGVVRIDAAREMSEPIPYIR